MCHGKGLLTAGWHEAIDRAHKGDGRLTGHSVARIVAASAARAGISERVSPHGLRHASITEALDAGVGVREVLAHSRHADVRTVLLYDDRRRDGGGKIAALVAAQIE